MILLPVDLKLGEGEDKPPIKWIGGEGGEVVAILRASSWRQEYGTNAPASFVCVSHSSLHSQSFLSW
jgi:hypothetical protein